MNMPWDGFNSFYLPRESVFFSSSSLPRPFYKISRQTTIDSTAQVSSAFETVGAVLVSWPKINGCRCKAGHQLK